jgi:hypothetical protein
MAYDHSSDALACLRALSRTTSRGYRFVFRADAGPPLHAHPHGQAVFSPTPYLQVVVAARMWMSSPVHLLWIAPDCPHEVRAAGDREMRPGTARTTTCLRALSLLPRELLLRLSDDWEGAPARGGNFMNAAIAELRRLAGGGDGLSQAAAIGDYRPHRSGAGEGSC